MHPPNIEEFLKVHHLRLALQTLAQPPEQSRELMRRSRMVKSRSDWLEHLLGEVCEAFDVTFPSMIPEPAVRIIRDLDRTIRSQSLGTMVLPSAEEMAMSHDWREIRRLAGRALEVLDWPDTPPAEGLF